MAAGEEEMRAHPDCRNASNPYHECNDFCFRFIADAKKSKEKKELLGRGGSDDDNVQGNNEPLFASSGRAFEEEGPCPDDDDDDDDQGNNEPVFALTGRQKKLAELERKMKEARKANEHDVEAEEKRSVAAPETRGISKQQWLEERKKKLGRLLDANGLDISKSYMLDTQEAAEQKYKKWEKEPAPYGWDVFNQKSLYNAYKKRTKNIQCDMEEYKKLSDADPEFYRDASSLQYGKVSRVSEDKINNMVDELKNREDKRKAFSRRRKFHDEKDIDSINDRNEHFNKKIERAFGKYTIEIKNNLERGTALPD